MTRVQNAIGQIRATIAEIDLKVSSLPTDWITWRPSPEVWSILDNLCHIEEFLPYWTGQILAIVADSTYEWGRTLSDSNRLAAVTNTTDRDPAGVIASIHERVDSIAQRLTALDDRELDTVAQSRNPRWGAKPASFILEELILQHLSNHCNQIQRNVDQLRNTSSPQEAH